MSALPTLFTDSQGRPAIQTQIVINAPLDQVWSVLTDFSAMPEWSSTFQGLEGPFEHGGDVTAIYRIFGRLSRFRHPLVHWDDSETRKVFGWSAPTSEGGSVIDDHYYIAEMMGPNQTRFIQTDAFRGMSRLMAPLMLRLVRRWYVRFNHDLKAQVEEKNILPQAFDSECAAATR
jgi:hypothetical protein